MKRITSILAAVVLTVAAGCYTPATDGGGGAGGAIVGQSRTGGGVQTVTAYAVEADGRTTAISASASVDAGGRYQLIARFTPGDQPLLIVAREAGGRVGAVVAMARTDAHGVVHPAPIDLRSTVEADAAVKARASNAWRGVTTLATLRAMVNSDVAEAVWAGNSYEADSELIASAALASSSALTATLVAEGRATDAQLAVAAAALARAVVELDAQLQTSTDTFDEAAAFDAYLHSRLRAYLDAGITIDHVCAATTAASDVMAVYTSRLTTRAAARLRLRAESLRARVVLALTTAETHVIDAGMTVQQAVARISAQLQADLDDAVAVATTGTDADVKATTAAAWIRFRTDLRAVLLPATGGAAAVVVATIDAAAATLAQVIADLHATGVTLGATATAAATVHAVTAFYALASGFEATLAALGIDAARARALVQVQLTLAASSS